jgi:hypothetical protein
MLPEVGEQLRIPTQLLFEPEAVLGVKNGSLRLNHLPRVGHISRVPGHSVMPSHGGRLGPVAG